MTPDCNVYGYLYLAKSASKRTSRSVSKARIIAVPARGEAAGHAAPASHEPGHAVRIVEREWFEARTAAGRTAVTDERGAFCVDVPANAGDVYLDLYAELIEVPGSDSRPAALGEPIYLALGQHVPFRVANRCHLMALVPAQIWRRLRRRIA